MKKIANKPNNPAKRIVILGGGPAGIGAAWRFKELGHKNWELYEKTDFLGGLSASFKDTKGFIWDIGGHIYFSKNDYFNRVFKKLMGKDFLKKERFQYIWQDNALMPYPFQNNIRHLPERELDECLKGLANPKKIKPKNFLEFNLASFGSGITKHFMKPYNEKVWSYPLAKMAFNWVGGRVSRIDFNKALENVIFEKDEANWGPNFYFNYPIKNGSGDFWSRFLPKLKDNIIFNSQFEKISFKKREVRLKDGKTINYDYLVSALPLDYLIYNSDAPKKIKKAAGKLVHNSGFILGLGVKGKQPEFLNNKVAFYFSQKKVLFQRMLAFKNFSPHVVPKNHWSLIFEASFSKHKPMAKEELVKNAIGFAKKQKWIKSDKDIKSIFIKEFRYFYPIPTLDRDKNLNLIQKELQNKKVYSIGRFGAWKYEQGNMDHSFMQGVEAAEQISKK